MGAKRNVLLASRSRTGLDELTAALHGVDDVTLRTRLLDGTDSGALFSGRPAADLVVLRFDPGCGPLLGALAAADAAPRPPLIVVGPAGDADAVRLAVRSGARDFLPAPVVADELRAAVDRVLLETTGSGAAAGKSDVTVVLGAAGGVGTSFVACNLAHACAMDRESSTLLVDLDVNDAPLAGFLDLAPERGLLEALDELRFLDEHALTGYVTRHHSGLHLMGAPSERLVQVSAIDANPFAALMAILTRRYRHLVIDGLHGLQGLSLAAVGNADAVLVVVQQSVVQLRQAVRLMRLLSTDVGFPESHTFVVVNRYRKSATVGLTDIERALGHERIVTVPNHYPTVHASIDGGVPLGELERSSAVAKAIADLQRQVSGTATPAQRSLLRRAFPILSGG